MFCLINNKNFFNKLYQNIQLYYIYIYIILLFKCLTKLLYIYIYIYIYICVCVYVSVCVLYKPGYKRYIHNIRRYTKDFAKHFFGKYFLILYIAFAHSISMCRNNSHVP